MESQKKKPRRRSRLVIWLGLLGGCCTISLLVTLLSPQTDEPESPTTAISDSAIETVIAQTEAAAAGTFEPTSAPTPLPAPSNTLEPSVALKLSIEDELSSANRDVPRLESIEILEGAGIITVRWAINDNITDGFRISGAKRDASTILQTIAESGMQFERVVLRGSFSMVDLYGNAEEAEVFRLIFDRAEYEQINWDNFLSDNIYLVAGSATVHPAFQD